MPSKKGSKSKAPSIKVETLEETLTYQEIYMAIQKGLEGIVSEPTNTSKASAGAGVTEKPSSKRYPILDLEKYEIPEEFSKLIVKNLDKSKVKKELEAKIKKLLELISIRYIKVERIIIVIGEHEQIFTISAKRKILDPLQSIGQKKLMEEEIAKSIKEIGVYVKENFSQPLSTLGIFQDNVEVALDAFTHKFMEKKHIEGLREQIRSAMPYDDEAEMTVGFLEIEFIEEALLALKYTFYEAIEEIHIKQAQALTLLIEQIKEKITASFRSEDPMLEIFSSREPVGTVILKLIDAMNEKIKTIKKENNQAIEAVRAAATSAETLIKEEAEEEIKRTRKEAEAKIGEVKKEIANIRIESSTVQKQMEVLRNKLEAKEKELKNITAEKVAVEAENKYLKQQLKAKDAQLQTIQKQILKIISTMKELKNIQDNLIGKITSEQVIIKDQIDTLNNKLKLIEERLQTTSQTPSSEELNTVMTQVANSQETILSLVAELQRVQRQLSDFMHMGYIAFPGRVTPAFVSRAAMELSSFGEFNTAHAGFGAPLIQSPPGATPTSTTSVTP